MGARDGRRSMTKEQAARSLADTVRDRGCVDFDAFDDTHRYALALGLVVRIEGHRHVHDASSGFPAIASAAAVCQCARGRDALLRASASAALHHASVLVTPPAAK